MTNPSARFPTTPALVLIFAAYAAARVLEIVPNPIPRTAIVTLDVLSALAFALVDGARTWRLRGILVFTGLCIVVGNIGENLGVVTGFPFGRYYFVELMGPKLFHVPILLGLAYIGMAYVSWTLGALIAGRTPATPLLAVPLAAGFIMVAWDLAQDPVWSTVLHGWVWQDGGPWFGVPVSNYFGWYSTVFLIYLCFALYLRRRPAQANANHGRAAILFYALCALGNVAQAFGHPSPAVVQDPTGHAWRVADITAASALVSIFLMGAFAVLAWIRLDQHRQTATD
ncbi:MAG: carotenoid biosynthesis protein [Terracidiphilus sp.]|nr:carotenoid biosynthesis protein [Terracidiphilus sp.]